jgi:multidrug efflux pump subunit AcrB
MPARQRSRWICTRYGVLVVLFKDFFQPVTILSAIPFSLGGALGLLLLSGREIDVASLIGMVTLIGVVTKIGGLITSTALSLLVVPAVFSCVSSVGSRVAGCIFPDGQKE